MLGSPDAFDTPQTLNLAEATESQSVFELLCPSKTKEVLGKRIIEHKIANESASINDVASVKRLVDKYLPKTSSLSRELLGNLLQSVDLTIEDLRSLTEQSHETSEASDQTKEMLGDYLENKTPEQKRVVYEWLLNSSGDKPQFVNFLEHQADRDLTDFPDHLRQQSREDQVMFLSTLFLGGQGILQDREQSVALLQDVYQRCTDESASEDSVLYTLIENAFFKCADVKKLELLQHIFNYISQDQDRKPESDLASASNPDVTKEVRKFEFLNELLTGFGTVGVKLGQVLSKQSQIVTDEHSRAALEGLSDQVPALPKQVVLNSLEYDDGVGQAQPFEVIDAVGPLLGSASIKQVYKVTDDTGQAYALKTIRPSAEFDVHENLAVLRSVIDDPQVRARFNISDTLKARVEAAVFKELDLQTEIENQEKIRTASLTTPGAQGGAPQSKFQQSGWSVEIPEVNRALSGEKYFADKLASGRPLKGLVMQALREGGQLTTVAELILEASFDHMFNLGVFNADLHAGNLLIDQDTKQITEIDFGNCGELSRQEQDGLIGLLIALERGNAGAVSRILGRLTGQQLSESLQSDLQSVVASERSVDAEVRDIHKLFETNAIELPGNIELVLKFFETIKYITDEVDAAQLNRILAKVVGPVRMAGHFLNTMIS